MNAKIHRLTYLKPAALMLFLLMLLAGASHAHNVTLNFAFRIGSDKNNTIHVNETDYNATQPNASTFASLDKKFITSERNNAVFSLSSLGKTFLSAFINTSYSSSDYLIQMKQGDEQNRFLFAFTNGTRTNAENALLEAGNKIPPRALGAVARIAREKFPLFIRAEYDAVDIASRIRWDGSVRIAISNQGNSNERTNVTLTLLSGG